MYLKKENQKSPELPITEFNRIQNIFTRNNWPIEGVFGNNVFDNFCKMLAELTPEQCDLIISLTEKFLWVQDFEYIKYFSVVFKKFINSYDFSKNKKIYICPLLPEDDFGKSKSSISLIYLIKSHLIEIQRQYPDFTITYADSPNLVNLDLIKNNNFTLCLIDDFIGTGETVERATKYFIDKEIPQNSIVILSLVAMKFGLCKLNSEGYVAYTNIECDKGLSPSGNQEQLELMKNIEDAIKVDDDFKFGYGASESLVKMMRTPNNTFPIYWHQKKGRNKYAPFPR